MELSDLYKFDYFIITVIFASGYFGWKKGFIQSFINFFAWIGSAIIVADNFSAVYGFLNVYIPTKFVCGFIASFVFYICLVILISFLGIKISNLTAKFLGGTVDKTTGAAFGVLRGVLISFAIFWCFYMSLYALNNSKLPQWFARAKGYKVLKIGSDSLLSLITSEEERQKMLRMIDTKTNKLEEELRKNIEQKKKEFNDSEKMHSE